jgi:transposase InsO family protein
VGFGFVRQEKAMFPIATQCRVLGVSPSGYYAWIERPPSARAQADAVLLEQIRAIHAWSRGTYGARRIRIELREQGIRCARKRVVRLMREAGLSGAQRRRYRGTTRQAREALAAPDLVKRDFTASRANQLWVADVTYVRTGEGWLYLATVLDAWSRRIVGWAMGETLRTQLVVEALNMAVWNRRPIAGVVHHSDRGAQYTSVTFSRRCEEAGVLPSMGSVGDAYDNALAEAFFATLEIELLMQHTFATRKAARLALFDFIEGFYNSHRRHSALGYLSPAEFERRQWQRPEVVRGRVREQMLSEAGG